MRFSPCYHQVCSTGDRTPWSRPVLVLLNQICLLQTIGFIYKVIQHEMFIMLQCSLYVQVTGINDCLCLKQVEKQVHQNKIVNLKNHFVCAKTKPFTWGSPSGAPWWLTLTQVTLSRLYSTWNDGSFFPWAMTPSTRVTNTRSIWRIEDPSGMIWASLRRRCPHTQRTVNKIFDWLKI